MSDHSQTTERYPHMDAIDAALARGRVEDNIPSDVEASAIGLFESESQGITGIKWDWTKASDEVRNRFRLRVLLREPNV